MVVVRAVNASSWLAGAFLSPHDKTRLRLGRRPGSPGRSSIRWGSARWFPAPSSPAHTGAAAAPGHRWGRTGTYPRTGPAAPRTRSANPAAAGTATRPPRPAPPGSSARNSTTTRSRQSAEKCSLVSLPLAFTSACASHGGIGWMVRCAFVGVCAGRQWHVVDGEGAFAADVADEGGPPAQEGAEAVAEAGEEADMYEQPHHPAGEAAEVHPEGGDDRVPARDVGGRAQVVVAERLVVGVALGLLSNPAGGVEPGLHGGLGDPGQLVQAHHVPGHQDVG